MESQGFTGIVFPCYWSTIFKSMQQHYKWYSAGDGTQKCWVQTKLANTSLFIEEILSVGKSLQPQTQIFWITQQICPIQFWHCPKEIHTSIKTSDFTVHVLLSLLVNDFLFIAFVLSLWFQLGNGMNTSNNVEIDNYLLRISHAIVLAAQRLCA